MSFSKFTDLVINKRLHFTRVDQLSDVYEASMPFNSILEALTRNNDLPQRSFVNCWTIGNDESYAHWKIYLDGEDNGVAVRSTISSLQKSFVLSPRFDDEFFIGKISYGSHREAISGKEEYLALLNKKKYYEYEKEIRIGFISKEPQATKGFQLSVDVPTLVEEVFVSPFAKKWFRELVPQFLNQTKSILADRVHVSRVRQRQ